MWDMDEEHREILKEKEIYFVNKVTEQFEDLISMLYQLEEFHYTSFAVDVFMLKGRQPEQAMKDTIYKYYQLFSVKKNDASDRDFLGNDIWGNQVKVASLQECIKYVLQVDDDKIHKMPVSLRREFTDTLDKSASHLNIISHGRLPNLYVIPKECKAFYSEVVSEVYLGLIFKGSYLVYNDYCILVVFGSTE